MRAWRKSHRESVRKSKRSHYAKNKAKYSAINSAAYKKKSEQRKAWQSRYRLENSGKVKESRMKYASKNAERIKLMELERAAKRRAAKYGMSIEQYEDLIKSCSGKCSVCHRPFDKRGPAVDHCHNTDMVRGVLCYKCNMAEGLLGSPETAFKLAEYMARNGIFYGGKN